MTTTSTSIQATLGAYNLELSPYRDSLTVGRAPESDLVSSDRYVSRRHGLLTRAPNGNWMFTDLGSSGGSYVGGIRITSVVVTPRLTINLGHQNGPSLTFSTPDSTTVFAALVGGGSPGLGPMPSPAPSGYGHAQVPPVPTAIAYGPDPGSSPSNSRSSAGTSVFVWVAVVVLAVATGLGMAAWISAQNDTVTLSVSQVENEIEDGLQDQWGLATNVDCPSVMEGEQGDEFYCVVDGGYTGRTMVVVHIENDQGDITWRTV